MKHVTLFRNPILIAFALFAIATTSFAQPQPPPPDSPPASPPVPPPVSSPTATPPPAPAPVPQMVITRTLANGVTVKKQSIPGIHGTAILIQLYWGDDHDPADGPGLSQLLIDLAATAPLDNDKSSLLTPELLDKKYPRGWVARSHPEHAVLAYVVSGDDLDEQLQTAAARITQLEFTTEAVQNALARMRDDVDRRFRKEIQLTPMSWITAKAFRHVSHPHYGISPDKLDTFSPERLRQEWDIRTDPRTITLFLVGNLGPDETALDTIVNTYFATIKQTTPAVSDLPITVKPEQGRDRRRKIIVDQLPGEKESVVVAFYAPPITGPDHPAFLAVAEDFMKSARKLPGAQVRLPFQYSMLLDSRAAYLTPHIWRFPKGAGQALGFWTVKILNRKFSNTDGRSTLHRLAWQLGSPIPGSFVRAVNKQPALLYTIAYATAIREDAGDAEFWESYRNKLKQLRKDDLAAARDEYFTDKNEAIFVLTP